MTKKAVKRWLAYQAKQLLDFKKEGYTGWLYEQSKHYIYCLSAVLGDIRDESERGDEAAYWRWIERLSRGL